MNHTGRYARIARIMQGSAYGDALGYPVEFMHVEEIKRYRKVNGTRKVWEISDDTQMSAAVFNSVIEAKRLHRNALDTNYRSLLRWYDAQHPLNTPAGRGLYAQPWMRASRAPGMTCMRELGKAKRFEPRGKDPKSGGCGAVMRAHPHGFLLKSPEDCYKTAVQAAQETHFGPKGSSTAGFMAAMVRYSFLEETFFSAFSKTLDLLNHDVGDFQNRNEVNPLECGFDFVLQSLDVRRDIQGAMKHAGCWMSFRAEDDDFSAMRDQIHGIGGGWDGSTALAIALYTAHLYFLGVLTLQQAFLVATDHDGDSDSTGAIFGALAGAFAHLPKDVEFLSQVNVEASQSLNYMVNLFQLVELKEATRER